MGTTLTGQIVSETYDSLLKVTDNNVITGTKKRITDGFGNDTPLLLSSTDVQVDGNFLAESVQFNTSTLQTADAVGKLVWNNTDGTLDLRLKGNNVTLQIGQEQLARVVNGTGANLLESEYRAVKVIGAQGQRLQVGLAQANNDLNSATTIGIVTENINNNQEGFICIAGQVREINTTGSLQGETWADGDVLYLSGTTAGHITNVKPSAPTHTIILGFVEYAHAVHGKIYVKVDNGYELDELHNVSITSPTNGQVLAYDSSTSLWKNSSNGNGTVTSVSGTGTVSGLTLTGTVTSSGSLTLGGALSLTSGNVTDALGYTPVTNARTISTTSPLSGGGDLTANRTLSIAQSTTSTDGYLSSTDWNTFNSKVPSTRTLTINGTSYDLSADRSWTISSGGITTLNTLTASTQTFATGTSGSDFNISSATSTHTFNLPTASGTNRGALSSTDWTTFNNKQATITGGATTITTSNLTVSRALVSDGSGKVAVATTTATEIGYVNGVTSAIQTQLDDKVSKTSTFNAQLGSYTLVLGDAGKIIEMQSGSANNLTVPLNSSVAFPVGTEIQVLQFGAGQTTIVATVGVTLRSKSSQLKIGNQYTGVTLVKRGTNDWYVIGNLTA